MARRCFVAYFILTLCLVCRLDGGQPTKYQFQGQKVTLRPDINGRPDGILWKHNGNKVVEFNGKEQTVYKQFEDRITLDWHSAELNISNLRFEDSGEYELEVDSNKGLSHSLQKLEVIDKVAKPTITCTVNTGSSSNRSAKLECSAESRRPRPLMKFEWESKGNVQPGPKLTIPLGGKHDDEEHICRVSNALSRESAKFTAKDCYTKTSSVALIAGLVSLVSLFGLLLIVGSITLYLKWQKKACFGESDKEKQSQPGPEEGAKKPLLPSESTLACNRPPRHLNDNAADMGIKEGHVERAKKQLLTGNDTDEHVKAAPLSHTPLDVNNLSNNQSYVDEEEPREPAEEVPEHEPSDSEETNEADPPAAVLDDKREDTQAGLEVPTSPQKPGYFREMKGVFESTYGGRTAPKKWPTGNDTDEPVKAAPPPPPCTESPSQLDMNNLSHNDKSDVDEEEPREPAEEVPKNEPSDSEEPNKADPPAAASDDKREDMQAGLEVPTSPHTPEPENVAERNVDDKEADEEEMYEDDEKKKADEDEEVKSAPHNAEASPAAFTAGENEEDANSDQVTEETAEKTGRESDSSGEEERKESDESSTAPEEKSSETTRHEQDSNLSQEATQAREDQQPETVEPVSENENEPDKEKDFAEPDLYSDNSQQPLSPTPTKSEIRNTRSPAACQDPAHADQGEESDDGEGKKDKSENQCGPKEEEPAGESLSEDKGAKER